MKVQKKLGAIHASAAAAALSALPLLRRLHCRHLLRCGGSRAASIRSILNNAPAPYFPLCKNDPGIKPQGRFCLLLRLRAAHPSSELFLRHPLLGLLELLGNNSARPNQQVQRCRICLQSVRSLTGRLTLAALTGHPSSTGHANCSTRIRQRALHQEQPQNQPWALRQAEDALPGSRSRFPARSW